jgi:hypothetical protein
MLKKDFQKILNEEIEFSGKRFTGDSDQDRKNLYFRFAERYYDSLGYLTESALKTAFKKCREQFEYFPKINQLLKFCSTEKPAEQSIDYKALPQSKESKDMMKKAMAGGSKFQVGEETLRGNFALLSQRWPHSNWDEALNREIEIDSHRLVRG